jgi:hypothetical protein
MCWACNTYEIIRNAHKILVRKTEGKKPLVRPRRKWEDNIVMDFEQIACEDLDWIHLAEVRSSGPLL